MTVTGTGALTARGTAAEDSYGIFANNNDLTVNGGVVVTGIGGQGPEGAEDAVARGIYASPTGESSVLVSSNRSGAGLRPLAGGDYLRDFPYCVVYNPAVTEVVICRDDAVVTEDSLQVPAEDSLTVTYTATILDQLELEMTDQSVTWSMEGALPQGVSVDNGRVTVNAGAADGSFTLTAKCDNGMTASVVITVSNKKAAGVTISSAPQAAARSIRDFRPSGGTWNTWIFSTSRPRRAAFRSAGKRACSWSTCWNSGEKVWVSTPSSRSR